MRHLPVALAVFGALCASAGPAAATDPLGSCYFVYARAPIVATDGAWIIVCPNKP